jgi:hypothetical protein
MARPWHGLSTKFNEIQPDGSKVIKGSKYN